MIISYLYCRSRPSYQEGIVGIQFQLTGFCACPKPFVFNDMVWDIIVRFVIIGGIIHRHYLNCLFIIENI